MHTDTTNWVAIGSVTRSASPVVAPDGTLTAGSGPAWNTAAGGL